MGRKPSDDPGTPVSIRLSDELQTQLEFAAKKLHINTREVMRLAMRIGLEHFSRINYDLAKQIVDTVEGTKKPGNVTLFPNLQPLDLVAEEGNGTDGLPSGSSPHTTYKAAAKAARKRSKEK